MRAPSFSQGLMITLLVVGWLIALAVAVAVAVVPMFTQGSDWERLIAPLGILGAVIFTLLGATLSDVFGGQRYNELKERADRNELQVRKVEEEAMKGRALAALLQAEVTPEASHDIARHALLSRGLFGDLAPGRSTMYAETPPTSAPSA